MIQWKKVYGKCSDLFTEVRCVAWVYSIKVRNLDVPLIISIEHDFETETYIAKPSHYPQGPDDEVPYIEKDAQGASFKVAKNILLKQWQTKYINVNPEDIKWIPNNHRRWNDPPDKSCICTTK